MNHIGKHIQNASSNSILMESSSILLNVFSNIAEEFGLRLRLRLAPDYGFSWSADV